MLVMIRRALLVLALTLSAQALFAKQAAACEGLTLFAAASLKNALDEISDGWAGRTGMRIAPSYAGSSALARQIQFGAPADVFLSANVRWMDELERQGLVAPGTRRDLVGNRLVLIAPAPRDSFVVSMAPPVIGRALDLRGILNGGRLAIGQVDAVPAGIYGKAALQALGLWDSVASSLAQAENVRVVLTLVARGEAPLGVVYASDARASDNVMPRGVFPPDSHPSIVYPGAVVRDSRCPHIARAFLDALSEPPARAIFERHGFLRLDAGPASR